MYKENIASIASNRFAMDEEEIFITNQCSLSKSYIWQIYCYFMPSLSLC